MIGGGKRSGTIGGTLLSGASFGPQLVGSLLAKPKSGSVMASKAHAGAVRAASKAHAKVYEGDLELGTAQFHRLGPAFTDILSDDLDPDPVRAAERRKMLQKARLLETNRKNMNAQKASTLLAGMGEDLLQQSIQGGLLTQPLLSRGSLG